MNRARLGLVTPVVVRARRPTPTGRRPTASGHRPSVLRHAASVIERTPQEHFDMGVEAAELVGGPARQGIVDRRVDEESDDFGVAGLDDDQRGRDHHRGQAEHDGERECASRARTRCRSAAK